MGIGEQLMLLLYSKETNQNPWDVNKLRTERNKIDLKDCVPSWCKIESNEFKTFLKIIEKTTLNKNEEFKSIFFANSGEFFPKKAKSETFNLASNSGVFII